MDGVTLLYLYSPTGSTLTFSPLTKRPHCGYLLKYVCGCVGDIYFQLSTKSVIHVDKQTAKIDLLLPHILHCSWPSATSSKQQLTFVYLGPINTQSVLYMLDLLAIFQCYPLLLPFTIFKRGFFVKHYISN